MSAPKFTFTLFSKDGEVIEVSLPAKFEVCSTCSGKGTRVNPSIDGNGLSREDFDADPDFAEGYMRGDYDITCSRCNGERVVSVVDRARLTKEQRTQLRQHERDEEESRRDDYSERFLRMAESGGYG